MGSGDSPSQSTRVRVTSIYIEIQTSFQFQTLSFVPWSLISIRLTIAVQLADRTTSWGLAKTGPAKVSGVPATISRTFPGHYANVSEGTLITVHEVFAVEGICGDQFRRHNPTSPSFIDPKNS